MKTIFISAFNPFILRNILVGDALSVLKTNSDTRAVIFVLDYKAEFFRKEIGDANVIIEGVKAQQISRQDIIFRFINSSLADTKTLEVHKKSQLEKGRKRLRFLTSLFLMKILSRIKIFKHLSNAFDYWTISKNRFTEHFRNYQPDVVFATDIFNDDDVHLLAEAKSRGVKTVGMIRSWDNFTTKGFLRVRPHKLIVHNEVIKGEAVKYGLLRPENVFVSGIPQYDRYVSETRMPREEFFKKINLDPSRKLILFSPLGKRFSDTDWQIMEILKEFTEKNSELAAQVLVRFTPNDEVPLGNFTPNKYFYIDRPGHQFKEGVFRDQELGKKDVEWLADCLRYSNVVVAGGASIGIDAAIFGKPTILIYFDGFVEKPYLQSARRYLDYTHGIMARKGNALRGAVSKEELYEHLNDYLKNPDLDNGARQKMLAEQCWKLDGKSGKRIGEFLISQLTK